jgi:hypothetical protein
LTKPSPAPPAPSSEPVKDPLALGLGSLGGGVGFGGAVLTAAQVVVGLSPERYDVHSFLLTAGPVTALGVAAVCGWYRSLPLENIWQRGVIAVLGAVGALLVGFVAAPIDHFFGVKGMVIWLLLNIAFGIVATRWAIKGAGEK